MGIMESDLHCRYCERHFFSAYNLRRHLLTQHKSLDVEAPPPPPCFSCPTCDRKFGRRDNLLRHIARYHEGEEKEKTFRCGLCTCCFSTFIELHGHRKKEHVQHHDFREVESAHGRQTTVWRRHFPSRITTVDEALIIGFKDMTKLILSLLVEQKYFKVNFTLFVEMFRVNEEGQVSEMDVFPFRGFGFKVHREKDFVDEMMRVCGDIERNVDEFLFQGSGWIVSKPAYLEAEVVQCRPLRGALGSCDVHLASERVKKKKELCVTDEMGVKDGGCFFLAIAKHFLGDGAGKEELRRFVEEELVVPEGLEKHVEPKDIDIVEERNAQLSLAVSVVYEDEEGDMMPVRAAKQVLSPNHIVLLLFHVSFFQEDKKKHSLHYALVKDPSLLLAIRTRNETGAVTTTRKVEVCWNCHNTMSTRGAYLNHIAFCHKNSCQKVELPEAGEYLAFDADKKAEAKIFRSAYMLFFDFEALQVPVEKSCSCSPEVIAATRLHNEMTDEERKEAELEQRMLESEMVSEHFDKLERGGKKRKTFPPFPRRLNPPQLCKHKSKVMHNQPPFAYSYVLVSREGVVLEDRVYVGENAAEDFVMRVIDLSEKYLPSLTPGEPINLSPEEQEFIRSSDENICHICDKGIERFDVALDHDHLTGEYLGTAHNACNLRRREQLRLTCFAHNFTGYDSHFLVRAINKYNHLLRDIGAIPLNTQKFKSINLNRDKIVFVDSCQFLPDTLAGLVDMQRKGGNTFSILEAMRVTEKKKELLLRKGVYPYSSATSIKKLKEMTSLPPIEAFYNDLNEEACSQEDYRHAQLVWKTFNCQNMLEYTALYVRTDTYLLAEVVLKFRDTIFATFGLDMCQYLSLPHLAKDIMLKETNVEIELLCDQEMSDLLQKNIRGGLSFVNVRHAKRVEGGEEEYDDQRRTLLYIDANNLYGASMRHPLPLHDYRWMTEREIENFDVDKQVTLEDGSGYILEVDLEYPQELHLEHNSLPLAPEALELQWEDLSPYSKECLRVLKGGKEKYSAKKLTSTFRPRKNYLVHGLNLKLYLEHGLVLTKIHRGIAFYQESFLKDFIDTCSERRRTATSVTEQTLWKLVANSVYGKVRKKHFKKFPWSGNRTHDPRTKVCAALPLSYPGRLFIDLWFSTYNSLFLFLLSLVHRVLREANGLQVQQRQRVGNGKREPPLPQRHPDLRGGSLHLFPEKEAAKNATVLGRGLLHLGDFKIHNAAPLLQRDYPQPRQGRGLHRHERYRLLSSCHQRLERGPHHEEAGSHHGLLQLR